MARKPDPLSPADLLLNFEQALQRVAISPGIDAYRPHPSQEKFHRSTRQGKLYIGGNRSGKTVAGAAEAVMRLIGKHKFRQGVPTGPVRGRAVFVDIEEGIKKIGIPEIMRWMPVEYLKNGSWEDSYDKSSRTLSLTNGSFLEFMSYEQLVEKFAGTSRHFIWFDEEPPKEIFNECMMRLVDTDGDWWISMTPLIEMSWTKDQIYDPAKEGHRDDVFILEVNTEENPYINVQALDRLTLGLDASEKSARRSGTYITHTGLIYGPTVFSELPSSEGGNILDDVLAIPAVWRSMHSFDHFCMLDHGLNNPTAILFACYDVDGRIFIYDEIYVRELRVDQIARLFLSRVDQLGISPQYVVGDPAIQNRNGITGTSVQTEFAEHGINIALGNNDVRAGLARCQARFAKRLLLISQRCVNTLRERSNYRWDRFESSKIASRRNAKETPLKRNDHAMDAIRYGVCSRPAMDEEVDIPFKNVLGLPVAISHGMDWVAASRIEEETSSAYDDVLGADF